MRLIGYLLFALVVPSVVAMPLVAVAAGAFNGPIVQCNGQVTLDANGNPVPTGLCQFCDLFKLIHNIFQYLAFTVTPALSVVVFLIGAFLLMFSGASEQLKTQGKAAIRGAVIGIVIVLLSWLIIDTVINVLAEVGGGGGNAGFPWPWSQPDC